MSVLSKLDVVNEMLANLSELPVNSLAEEHPLVPTAVRTLATVSAREQSKSWWFNRELTDLVPDIHGHIYLPNDTLRVDPQQETLHYVQRGRRLYKPYEPSSANKYVFTQAVRCWLVREVPFEDLPTSAQMVVSLSAQLDFMKDYDADIQKYQQVSNTLREARITLNSEHTLNVDVNILRRRGGVYGGRTEVGVTRLRDALNRY